MSDTAIPLVKRLRKMGGYGYELAYEAANEIERLREYAAQCVAAERKRIAYERLAYEITAYLRTNAAADKYAM